MDRTYIRCAGYPVQAGSLLCVPLVALGETVGVIHVHHDRPGAHDADAQTSAVRVAEQIALALANRRLLAKLELQALTDSLTNLRNGRFLDPFLDQQLAIARRDGGQLGIIVIDIDHFKRFNDTHGHPAGDEALRIFAREIVANVREADVVARYVGEEFVVAVANGDVAATRHVAEKLRSVTERIAVEVRPGQLARLTISCGVASTELHGSERIQLVRTADRALYRAKEHGRNRVEVAQADEQTVANALTRPG